MRYKLLMILFICIFSLYIISPNFINNNFAPSKKINLGLDLKGGSSLLLKVDFAKYMQEKMNIILTELSSTLSTHKVSFSDMINYNNYITFHSEKNAEDLRKIIHEFSGDLKITQTQEHKYQVELISLSRLKKNILSDSISSVQRRIDELGTREVSIQPQGSEYILVQVPGLQDPAQLKSLLGKTAKLSFHLISDNNKNTIMLKDKMGRKYPVKKKIELSGDLLSNAAVTFNNMRAPAVKFQFNITGAKKFAKITKDNVGKLFAIVLDDQVLMAPQIKEPIMAGQGEISGHLTLKEAKELAVLLRSGSLPAPLDIVEERVVGPSLGEDAIFAGIIASIISILVISLFMIVIYGVFGICAAIALIINLFMMLAFLTIMDITLTLSGIAGIVLTIGMAVDANVLIFERIKEEYSNSKKFKKSINRGFKNAMTTILDSNITTLIAAIIMFFIGVGAVKGFAVTLSLGILSSMFAAIVITKQMIAVLVKKIA